MKTSTFAIALILSQYIDVSTSQLANASIKRTRATVDEQVSSLSKPQQQQQRVNTARLLSKKTRRKNKRNLQEMSVPSNDMMSLTFDGMCMSAATTVVSGSFAKNGDLVTKGDEPLVPSDGPGGHLAKSSKVYKSKSEKDKSPKLPPMPKAEKATGD